MLIAKQPQFSVTLCNHTVGYLTLQFLPSRGSWSIFLLLESWLALWLAVINRIQGKWRCARSKLLSCCSVAKSRLTLWPHELQHVRLPCPSPTPGVCSHSTSIESMMPSNHLILCHPLLLLPSVFPSIRAFPNESAIPIRWWSIGALA